MYNLAKAYRSIRKSIANRRVEDWEASNCHTKDTTRLFHGPLHDPVDEHICAQPFRMRVSLIFQRRKIDANKEDYKIKLDLTCQFNQPPTPNNRDLNQVILCTSGSNLAVLA